MLYEVFSCIRKTFCFYKESLRHFSTHFCAVTDLCSCDIRLLLICVPGSSVGTATDYGLDGPGSNPSGDEIIRPSRPALGPTQPRVKWALGLSQG